MGERLPIVRIADLCHATEEAVRQDAPFHGASMARSFAIMMDPQAFADLETVTDRARSFRARGERFLGLQGQLIRATILLTLVRHLGIDAFIETGTQRGYTSLLFLCQTSLRVFSSERDPRFHRFAKTLLSPFDGRASLYAGDSRPFIRLMMNDESITTPFFYLDAHGNGLGLPLNAELMEILGCKRRTRFLVAIDDFKIPWDSEYRHDVYSDGTIDLDYISLSTHSTNVELAMWLPKYAAAAESGYTTGFILIAPQSMRVEVETLIPGHLLQEVGC